MQSIANYLIDMMKDVERIWIIEYFLREFANDNVFRDSQLNRRHFRFYLTRFKVTPGFHEGHQANDIRQPGKWSMSRKLCKSLKEEKLGILILDDLSSGFMFS